MYTWILRGLFVIFSIVIADAYLINPGTISWLGISVGLVFSILSIIAEIYLRALPFRCIIGALIGLSIALIASHSLGYILSSFPELDRISILIHIIFAYIGILVGYRKGSRFDPEIVKSYFTSKAPDRGFKLLDTSVIIDGRIAEICDTGFLEGTLIVPRFVLIELQYVADSSDSVKRNRGRRGLEILRNIQKKVEVKVKIEDMEFPELKDVDSKLVEMAKVLRAKILTNDYNLNKVAELQGVEVLNINDLSNAVKPPVLPGEGMRVFITKEGKEYGQGVAYLDDGTMVVVDEGRNYIGQSVNVAVTSVLQTTAGRMIFARMHGDENRRS